MADKKHADDEKEAGQFQVCRNARARFRYTILETVEAGLALVGTEVKSLRQRKASLEEAYARVQDGEVWLCGCEIQPYVHGNRQNHAPRRPRKLLLHRRQIGKLAGQVSQRGLTLIPLSIYFRRGLAKVQLAVARGRRTVDKRQAIKERDAQRDIARALARRRPSRP